MIKKFNQYVQEAILPEIAADLKAKAAEIKPTVSRLLRLEELGLASDVKAQVKQLNVAFVKAMSGSGINPRESESLATLIDLGKEAGLTALMALETDGAEALRKEGLVVVSSMRQLANGNLIWSLDPAYAPHAGWGIGFFPGPRTIRRMTPKGIKIGVWGRYKGSMDIRIKKFSEIGTDLEFFNYAMKWAADNIDFEQVRKNPESTTWKYYTKRRSPKEERDEAQELIIQARELGANLGHNDDNMDEYYQKKAMQYDLLAKAANLNGNINDEQRYSQEAAFLRSKISNRSAKPVLKKDL